MKSNIIFIALIFILLLINAGCKSKSDKETIRAYKQEWLILDVDHYRNGDIIPQVQDPKEWANLKTGAWCYYENDLAKNKKYGKLYNWYAISDPRGFAPEGWHVPGVKEFKSLELFVKNDGNALKLIGEGSGVNKGTNTVGFSATLIGYRNNMGLFKDKGNYAAFWASEEFSPTHANSVFLNNFNNGIAFSNNNKEYGFSVRCAKD